MKSDKRKIHISMKIVSVRLIIFNIFGIRRNRVSEVAATSTAVTVAPYRIISESAGIISLGDRNSFTFLLSLTLSRLFRLIVYCVVNMIPTLVLPAPA